MINNHKSWSYTVTNYYIISSPKQPTPPVTPTLDEPDIKPIIPECSDHGIPIYNTIQENDQEVTVIYSTSEILKAEVDLSSSSDSSISSKDSESTQERKTLNLMYQNDGFKGIEFTMPPKHPKKLYLKDIDPTKVITDLNYIPPGEDMEIVISSDSESNISNCTSSSTINYSEVTTTDVSAEKEQLDELIRLKLQEIDSLLKSFK